LDGFTRRAEALRGGRFHAEGAEGRGAKGGRFLAESAKGGGAKEGRDFIWGVD